MSTSARLCVLPLSLLDEARKLGAAYMADYYSSSDMVRFLEQNSTGTSIQTSDQVVSMVFRQAVDVFKISGVEGHSNEFWILFRCAAQEFIARNEKSLQSLQRTIDIQAELKNAWPIDTPVFASLEMKKAAAQWVNTIGEGQFGVFCMHEWGKY